MFDIKNFPKKNLKWWFQQAADIDFDPDFQRTSRAWSDRDQAFLIDSILNGFDIPKVYIADFTTHDIPALNRRRKSYALIDGKQRMTAIYAFFRNRLPLRKKFILHSSPTTTLGGLRFRDLERDHPAVARLFESYVLDVKAIETDDRKKINDVFLRLNKASKALNGAEMRNARIGKAVEAIREMVSHNFFRRRITFDTARSQERNACAKILLLEHSNGPADTKKRNLDRFVDDVGELGNAQFSGTLRRAKAGIGVLHSIFRNQDPLLGAQGHLPLYYMFITRLDSVGRRKVRDFLVDFERRRVRNRNGGGGNQRLNRYDLASRSTNDKGTFETRLQVIRAEFSAWRRNN